MAVRHKICSKVKINFLLNRLKQNEDVLRTTYKLVINALREGQKTTPAAEWLLDNFHLIEEQIRTSKLHLPRRFCRELPVVDDPKWKLQARIYLIARELINHTDGHLDCEGAYRILQAYQKQTPLRLGELWAFPIMLRLGLIDTLRHIAESIATSYVDQSNAKFWAERMIMPIIEEPQKLITTIAQMAQSEPRMSSAFVSEFSRRIQASCYSPTLPLTWIEEQVVGQGLTLESHQNLASQDQAHDQVSMSNCIASLRFLSDTDWRDFVEKMSGVEAVLKKDPSQYYSKMDFATRDSYRHVIEYIARHSQHDELTVANAAMTMAQESPDGEDQPASMKHIGEYLVGQSRHILERKMHVKPKISDRIRRGILAFPLSSYFVILVCLAAALLYYPVQILNKNGSNFGFVAGLALLLTFPAIQCALSIVNWMTVLILKPKAWSRMDFTKGVSPSARTMVVVPCMLTGIRTIEKLIENLEIRYLGNRDDNILFGLLTDFGDSEVEVEDTDSQFIGVALKGIRSLNDKYSRSEDRQPFYLFHRSRRWNPGENMWMGYERKRGKLSQLNNYLRALDLSPFSSVEGNTENLYDIRYVLTLDADSTLPRETARTLIATMAHPLNQPQIDKTTRVVKEGYAILQPRITIHLKDKSSSHFTRLLSDDFGIDPYTKSVSDIYQDLFHEGSYIGKGIYDLDAFQETLDARFPENRILSHDLIEGGFARSGLVSDVQLVEEFPSSYSLDASRRHRWMRGDWQIASWILPMIPNGNGLKVTNPLSLLSRWKISDNLRRSVTPIATIVFLLSIWKFAPELSASMTFALLIYLVLPPVLNALNIQSRYSASISVRQMFRDEMHSIGRAISLSILHISFLPYDAFLATDATVRALYRLLISKRKLLEWQNSSDAGASSPQTFTDYSRLMWIAPLVSIFGFGIVFAEPMSSSLFVIAPVLGLWLLAPPLAWWISRPLHHKATEISVAQRNFLRGLSRKTWLYFETFLTKEDNWLPPDNFQEFPAPIVAHRTSPTNIGLSLLSILGAYDFGYISLASLATKLEQSMQSLERLERYKGHFYNWYDTQSLKPLLPLYVSTVDSGNLQGALLVLRQGLSLLGAGNLHSARILPGLEDLLFLIEEDEMSRAVQSELTLVTISKTKAKFLEFLHIGPEKSQSIATGMVDKLNAIRALVIEIQASAGKDSSEWIERLLSQIAEHTEYIHSIDSETSVKMRDRLIDLASRASAMLKLNYAFLYNPSNKLLSIGYHVADSRLDQSYYDLLASEARLASFLAVADGSVPQEHWFALGRNLTFSGRESTLLSWSGSMFEYLMPLLIMPSYEGTLLDQACRVCIHRQIQYGRERNVPWGISESAYNLTDAHYTYQYRAFGVPGLGLKRGLEQDLVVAPYATVMALMLEPLAACVNLKVMAAQGFLGKFGFFDAIDYTPSRVPVGDTLVIVRNFMVHHQGMSFLSLAHYLLHEPMQARMVSDPSFKATELLLHERVPKESSLHADLGPDKEIVYPAKAVENSFRLLKNPSKSSPDVHLLGNEHYHVVVSSAGGGYSSWKDIMLTRWREDRTRDAYGYFFYIKDIKSSVSWSVGYQPMLNTGDKYEVIFTEGRAEIRRSEDGLDTHLEIAVSPDDDAELRRLTIFNHSTEIKIIEVTTYAEVVLAPAGADLAHPAFSNLFIETEAVENQLGILCRRRGREPHQNHPWLYHAMFVHGCLSIDKGIETDRNRFVGRNHGLNQANALNDPLENGCGAVLDPIISLRKRITIAPGGTAIVDSILGVHEKRAGALSLMESLGEKQMADRILELAWTHGHVLLQQLNCSAAEALLYGKMASALIYGGSNLRASSAVIKANVKSLAAFWSYGISGDKPIVLLRLDGLENLSILQQLVRGHDYWRRKGLAVDFIIWNENRSGYRQNLNDQIMEVIASAGATALVDKPGGIFVRRTDQMPDEDRILFQAAARIIVSDRSGTLEEQVNSAKSRSSFLPKKIPTRLLERRERMRGQRIKLELEPKEILFADNGLGGFSEEGREYVLRLGPGKSSPMPWVNVLANPGFGTLISEAGSAYTWSENAHEHRLTPWFNDPVSDPTGEALYIRDELTGDFWSPTPGPAPANAEYIVRHGFGYSSFATSFHGLSSVVTNFVDTIDPVKIIWIKLTNQSSHTRQLSVTAYFELVLGELRSKGASQIVSEFDSSQGIMHARNMFAADFRDRLVFLSASDPAKSFSGDRTEFVGRNGSLANPAAMDRLGLSDQVGALFDPCLAMQFAFELAPGETKEIAISFGVGRDLAEIRRFSKAFRSLPEIQVALDRVHQQWLKLLGRIEIETPDRALNVLGNGWLLYQTISSRIWGRTGFYQSGGAYGFRDQLQDMMAVVYCAPELVREHIIRSSSRQFIEGDVQHWWHPPQGRGVRTRISDDYLWLPYVTEHYIAVTGDWGVLDEVTAYLSAKPLAEGAESEYSLPLVSEDRGTVYDHCLRALRYGMKYGSHGLPLMGCGDWNDGMNLVGINGQGESIWLGFFLFQTLQKFSEIALQRDDSDFAALCEKEASQLKGHIEANAWDGAWYLRAFFDDGSPLGSAQNQECQLDSLPQSWAVLSGASTGSRAKEGMDAVYKQLVNQKLGIIKLFIPPFDKQLPNPGYVSGYLPGVRENGGQYTHAALWVVMAFAELGEVDRALELLMLINPILHANSPDKAARYKIEPYVIAGDVYAAASHEGRGGWSWYTGSAAWFYRTIVETFLGFHLMGDKVLITPRLPSTWPEIKFKFLYQDTSYVAIVKAKEAGAQSRTLLDGLEVSGSIQLINDKKRHEIGITV
ncbi:MAG: cyclic beta 1-2 glucan synthetase [Chitinophagaceae bacterium]|nr:cyclic beta 1-2 glucan synthetase [Oligoflexus sp.]